ncbi:hypothetical protein RSAG8_12119, partial [Rhizoctonia solani AG-8 WAC10335]
MSASFEQSIIQQWEEAGASLANVLANYLKLSTFMENTCLRITKNNNQGDLAGRIDKSLETLHVTLYQQLNQTRVTLAKTRNRLTSPVYCLPEEILSEIFLNVVFTPKAGDLDQFPRMDCHVRNLPPPV